MHQSITISFGGSQGILKICALTNIIDAPIILFQNLTLNCKPINTKFWNYHAEYTQFIVKEILQLPKDDIIAPNHFAWYT